MYVTDIQKNAFYIAAERTIKVINEEDQKENSRRRLKIKGNRRPDFELRYKEGDNSSALLVEVKRLNLNDLKPIQDNKYLIQSMQQLRQYCINQNKEHMWGVITNF